MGFHNCSRKEKQAKKDLCFYKKTDTEIHLICKPGRQSVLEKRVRIRDHVDKKGIAAVSCRQCDLDVGFDLPFGPKGTSFLAFGSDKSYSRGYDWTARQCGRQYIR